MEETIIQGGDETSEVPSFDDIGKLFENDIVMIFVMMFSLPDDI